MAIVPPEITGGMDFSNSNFSWLPSDEENLNFAIFCFSMEFPPLTKRFPGLPLTSEHNMSPQTIPDVAEPYFKEKVPLDFSASASLKCEDNPIVKAIENKIMKDVLNSVLLLFFDNLFN